MQAYIDNKYLSPSLKSSVNRNHKGVVECDFYKQVDYLKRKKQDLLEYMLTPFLLGGTFTQSTLSCLIEGHQFTMKPQLAKGLTGKERLKVWLAPMILEVFTLVLSENIYSLNV